MWRDFLVGLLGPSLTGEQKSFAGDCFHTLITELNPAPQPVPDKVEGSSVRERVLNALSVLIPDLRQSADFTRVERIVNGLLLQLRVAP